MKKSIVSHLATFILGGIIFGSVGATMAYSYLASDISYTTSHNSNVQNVEQAINDLYDKAEKNYIDPIGKIVYFDPVNNTSCDTYTSSNSLNQTKTGCLKWYVIKDNGSSVDAILDHNTTYVQQWYSSATNVAYESSLIKPKIDLLTTPTTTSGGSGWNSSLSPRLITAEEVFEITNGPSTWNVNNHNTWYSFGSKNQTGYLNQTPAQQAIQWSYHWLYDYTASCIEKGCAIEDNSSSLGYWTATTSGVAGSGSRVWRVCGGDLYDPYANNLDLGVRPVVSISKSQL